MNKLKVLGIDKTGVGTDHYGAIEFENGVKLYFNGKFAGEINDLIFAKRFIDIWLSDKSSYPKMTQDILGKNE